VWVEKILERNKRSKLVIILDSLDSLDEREKARDLLWIPLHFPAACRVILSTVGGKFWEILQRRNYTSFTLSALTEAQRISFLRMNLNLSSKKLTEEQEFKVCIPFF
jgi:hypothetical protein